MARLEPGMLIKTNYSGPYRIKSIDRDCTCVSYLDLINNKLNAHRRPHIHLMCEDLVDGKTVSGKTCWLNGYDEDTLESLELSYCGGKSILGHDKIFLLDTNTPIQTTLF